MDVGKSECENIKIFLALIFCVKSVYENAEVPKVAILLFCEALKLDFHDFLQFLKAGNCQKLDSKPLKLQNASF